jgi:hypothetical protein
MVIDRLQARTWVLGACFAAVTIVAAPAARAQAVEASAADAYAAADERFRSGDYTGALEVVDAAIASGEPTLPLLRLRGDLLLELRDFEGALAAWEAFLEAGPRGGNLRKAQRIIRDLAVVRTTALEVTVEEGPAEIYLDSKTLGLYCTADPTCRKGMLPGRYRLFIEREGFEPRIERIEVRLGQTTTIERALVERPSEVSISVAPDEAQVSVGGEALGAGAQQLTLAAGEHEVVVNLDGFATERRSIEARRGEPVQLEVALAELVRLEVNAADPVILLDGDVVELVDGTIPLAPSTAARQLTVQAPGYQDAMVEVAPDRPRGEAIAVELEAIPEPEIDDGPALPITVAAPAKRGPARMVAASGFGALSVASLAAATGFGLHARSRWNASKEHCDDEVLCNEEGFALVRSAQTSSRRADVSFATAGGAAAAGLALWLLPEPEVGRGRRYAIVGLGAGGLASFAVAGGFGLEAKSRWEAADPHCDVLIRCDEQGILEVDQARAAARRGNVMLVTGSAMTMTSLALWLFPSSSPAAPPPSVRAGPTADGSGMAVSISGSFR